MRKDFNQIDVYYSILKEMADEIDDSSLNEVSDYLSDELMFLTCRREYGKAWFEEAEKLTCQAIEFMNLCAIKSTQIMVATAIIQVVVRLCELQRNVYLRRAENDSSKFDQLSIIDLNLLEAGECIITQERKYWLALVDLFHLNCKAKLSNMITILERENEFVQSTKDASVSCASKEIEELAKRILREAADKNHGISTSFVQRYFGVGYGKAACAIDWMEQNRYGTGEEIEKHKCKTEKN